MGRTEVLRNALLQEGWRLSLGEVRRLYLILFSHMRKQLDLNRILVNPVTLQFDDLAIVPTTYGIKNKIDRNYIIQKDERFIRRALKELRFKRISPTKCMYLRRADGEPVFISISPAISDVAAMLTINKTEVSIFNRSAVYDVSTIYEKCKYHVFTVTDNRYVRTIYLDDIIDEYKVDKIKIIKFMRTVAYKLHLAVTHGTRISGFEVFTDMYIVPDLLQYEDVPKYLTSLGGTYFYDESGIRFNSQTAYNLWVNLR